MDRTVKRKAQDLVFATTLFALALVALRFRTRPVESIDVQPAENESAAELDPRRPLALQKTQVTACPACLDSKVPVVEEEGPVHSWFRPRKGVAMPLVFQQLDPELLHLSQAQVAAIQQLRVKFVEEIGETNQSPDDPAYLEKWQRAQPECDAMLWVQLGKDIYLEVQLQAFASASFAGRGE